MWECGVTWGCPGCILVSGHAEPEDGKEGLTQISGSWDGLAGQQELISACPYLLLPQSRAVARGKVSHKAGGGW